MNPVASILTADLHPDPVVILRDDDTGFHTTPAMLDQVYGKVWERGWTVALAVIPAHQGATRVRFRRGHPYDPGVPPRYRGDPTNRSILENSELVAYLNDKVDAGLVQIVLHGFNHAFYEFESDDEPLLRTKLTDGLSILHDCFPQAAIGFFVAPYDRVSPTAIRLLDEFKLSFCTASFNLPRAGLLALPPYQHATLSNGKHVYTCDEYLFHRLSDPAQSGQLSATRLADHVFAPTMIFANHYWMFYKNWAEPNLPLLNEWYATIDRIADSGRRVTRFGA